MNDPAFHTAGDRHDLAGDMAGNDGGGERDHLSRDVLREGVGGGEGSEGDERGCTGEAIAGEGEDAVGGGGRGGGELGVPRSQLSN